MWQTPRLEDYATRFRKRGTRPSRARRRHLGHTKNDAGSRRPPRSAAQVQKDRAQALRAMPEHASTPALVVQAVRPPQLPHRTPMLRLPSERYKIAIRPRLPIILPNIGLATLLEAKALPKSIRPEQKKTK
ncbi:hypothetical protein MRX96_007688 [Rhipicephalus microplus]